MQPELKSIQSEGNASRVFDIKKFKGGWEKRMPSRRENDDSGCQDHKLVVKGNGKGVCACICVINSACANYFHLASVVLLSIANSILCHRGMSRQREDCKVAILEPYNFPGSKPY